MAEESTARARLERLKGVEALEFNIFNRSVTVTHVLPDERPIVNALRDVGLTANPIAETKTTSGSLHGTGDQTETRPAPSKMHLVTLILSGLLAFGAEIVAWRSAKETSPAIVALALASILTGGLPTLRKGLYALRSFTLNINFLMTVAVIGACAIGEWPEAAVVIFLFGLAEMIEGYSLDRARNAVRSLMAMTPDVANVKQTDGTWIQAAASDVAVGSIVRVKPGDRLPLDGVVEAGASAVDQAPITGESVPVDKTIGDFVFAGTVNGNGVLEFRTTGGKDQTTIAAIIRTVQEAQSQRAPTQRFVDSFSRVYTPLVVALAAAVAVTPWLAFNQPFMPWLYKALVLLVIACPMRLGDLDAGHRG